MAVTITDACTCCDACLAECPNEAITDGMDIYTIDPDLCTECVGFSHVMRCVDVCPVECCILDPDHVETKEALLAKAKRLHPEGDFSGEIPSHV